MTSRHASRHAAVTITAGLLLASCAGAGAGGSGPAGHRHTYDLEVGQVLRFDSTADMSMDSEMLQMIASGPIRMSAPSKSRLEFTGQEGGTFIGAMVIEEMDIQGLEGFGGEMGGMLGDLGMIGTPNPFTLLPSGHSQLTMSGDTMPFSGPVSTSQGLQQYFIPWPERAIQPGGSWTDSTRQDTAAEEMAFVIVGVTTYTFVGARTDTVTGLAVDVVTAVLEGSMSGGASEGMGAEVDVIGTWSGTMTYAFDRGDGLLEHSRSTMVIDMTIGMGGMGMNIPMSMSVTQENRRIRQ